MAAIPRLLAGFIFQKSFYTPPFPRRCSGPNDTGDRSHRVIKLNINSVNEGC